MSVMISFLKLEVH